MNRIERLRGYRGSYLVGFIFVGVVALRTILFYWGQSTLAIVIILLALYLLLYGLEPWFSSRFSWYKFFYFPVQTALVAIFSNLHPFLDFQSILYIPLSIQAFRAFSRQAAIIWVFISFILFSIPLILNLGLLEGSVLILLFVAVGSFVLSYDFLYIRTRVDQAESQRLLADLQMAHQQLQEYALQAEELAAVRERNRLARELHDSVSQTIFSIRLTSQSARLLLERDPARVLEEIERLQEMTSSALNQLRTLIAELRPQ